MKRKINLEKVLAMMLILTQGVQLPPNGENHLLDQALAQAGLSIDGYVVSGYVHLERGGLYVLEKMLQTRLSTGDNILLFLGEELKVVLADNKGKAVSMQLITTDEQKAHYCRSFWQFFADNWGKGEIMGITALAKAYEEMSLSAEEKFCAEIAGFLDAEGMVYKNGGGVDGVYYSPKLAKGLSVAAQEINYNIVLRPHAGRTDVYLGYPVIYQTY